MHLYWKIWWDFPILFEIGSGFEYMVSFLWKTSNIFFFCFELLLFDIHLSIILFDELKQ